jgi:hypothetical protein
MSETAKITTKKKKQMRAMSTAPDATPVKPNTAEVSAMMKNAKDHLSTEHLLTEKKNPTLNKKHETSFRIGRSGRIRELKQQRKGPAEARG